MEKFLTTVLSIFLYLVTILLLLGSMLFVYFAYRDMDFKLLLFAILTTIGAGIIFNTARKK